MSDRIEKITTLEERVSELLGMVRADVPPTDSEAVISLLNAA